MNIELLNEINNSINDNVSLSDISSELAMHKSQIQLMLRIQKIVKSEYSERLEKLEELENDNQELLILNSSLKSDIDNLKITLEEIPCSNKELELEEENISLKNEMKYLIKDIGILEEKLSKYPYFIKYIFDEDERQKRRVFRAKLS